MSAQTRIAVNVRDQVRLATRAAHLRLEAKMDFDRRLTSLEAYRSLLEDFLRFLRPIEDALGALDLKTFGIDFSSRRKSSLLEADLRDLGHDAASLNSLPGSCLHRPRDIPQAFGVLYVLEGSSLGREVMLGKLKPSLHISPVWAGRFFNGYGRTTGAMWRDFVNALNDVGAEPDAARIIEHSALATFTAFEECLRMPGTVSQAAIAKPSL
ncbi:biliverdin-producing heme oxygenase [Rhodomicrobium sp. Az07]|uniref:biliverdin-producing heme oxygenase n=1 Tax=Rhodomicrobium sp. Az07 TaxID=2839034 RepID=UPI001BEC414D|nr:biliverdin-producing heme oxygenase [Rhodomicrobium sp. Az07]MBT3071865.1 biliverdin-producing heme oxygenase [Rhodomicrobium sp. Az07]